MCNDLAEAMKALDGKKRSWPGAMGQVAWIGSVIARKSVPEILLEATGNNRCSVSQLLAADKAAWFGVPLSSNSDQMQRVFWPWMQNWRKRSNLTRSVLHYCLWWPNRLGRHRQQHHSLLQRDYNISPNEGGQKGAEPIPPIQQGSREIKDKI